MEGKFYRWMFTAAAVYNALWGILVVLWPNLLFDVLAIPRPENVSWIQCIGMMVGVYAIGYWLISRDPVRYGPMVWVGLLGKLFGPIGLVMSASQGLMPWKFGVVNVFNDVIWLPGFIAFAFQVWKTPYSVQK